MLNYVLEILINRRLAWAASALVFSIQMEVTKVADCDVRTVYVRPHDFERAHCN